MEKLVAIEQLIDSLQRLPSVGRKSAERMAFAMLNFSQEELNELSINIKTIKEKVHPCPICGLYTENAVCSVCSDTERNSAVVIVVANQRDVIGFEQLANYRGRYHVLSGLLGPTSKLDLKTSR